MSSVRPKLRQAWQRLRGGELTPKRAALSVGLGLAVGLVPVFGFHWAIILAVCVPLKLDAPVAYLAANISNPFFAPFLLLAEVQTGSLATTGALLPLTKDALAARGASAFASELVIGVAILAPLTAITIGALTYGVVALAKRKRIADGT